MASNDEKGRKLDGRYKQGVDKGAMSSLSIPLPLKPITEKSPSIDDIPKQILRQDAAKKKKYRKYN